MRADERHTRSGPADVIYCGHAVAGVGWALLWAVCYASGTPGPAGLIVTVFVEFLYLIRRRAENMRTRMIHVFLTLKYSASNKNATGPRVQAWVQSAKPKVLMDRVPQSQ